MRLWGSHSQNQNDQFLTLLAIPISPTDKEEGSRSIKLELRVSVFEFLDGVRRVAFVVIVLVHHQNRVRTVLVLENYNNNNHTKLNP